MSEKIDFNDFATKEDLVYWRLKSFEHELLDAIRDRPEGEGVLEAFGRFVRAPRGLLGDVDGASASSSPRSRARSWRARRCWRAKSGSSPGTPARRRR